MAKTQDRLLYIMEVQAGAHVGGTASFTVDSAAPINLVGFAAPAPLHLVAGYVNEAYLISDPFTAAQAQVLNAITDQSHYQANVSLVVTPNGIVKDQSNNARSSFALVRQNGESLSFIPISGITLTTAITEVP
jgi:hypothetical protein